MGKPSPKQKTLLMAMFSITPIRHIKKCTGLRISHYNIYDKAMLSGSTGLTIGDTGDFVLLVWLFVFIITALLLCLCYLYFSMRRSQDREQQLSDYSDLLLEGSEIERRRITRELHDIVMPEVKDPGILELIRSICLELASPDFARLSLKDSLAEFCMIFTRRTKIECACSIEEDLDFTQLKPENQLHLYRMIQESFTNIEKHSGAERAALTARRSGQGMSESLLICVSDDGQGLPGMHADEPSSKGQTGISGLGLMNLRQRAAILEAKLDIISEPGNGLMVRIEITK